MELKQKTWKKGGHAEPAVTSLTTDEKQLVVDIIEEALPSSDDEVKKCLDGNRTEGQGE